jgi:TolB-like protein/Flp pilus assembly protein TadD
MASPASIFAELKRRNVLRAGTFYAAAAWLLVQVATQVFPFFHISEWIVRWIVLAVVIGFPFALGFAWFYEITPEGLKLESEVEPSESITHRTAKTLDRWIIAALSLALVVLLANQFVLHRDARDASDAADAAAPGKSIAVLPLSNESGDAQQDYFSDGLTEELIVNLTQIGDLKVIGRNSSFQFRGKQQDDNVGIGKKLGVATLLQGTVRKQNDRVRIVVGLIRASDAQSLWSQTYDRRLEDVFAVQSEIATAIAAALKVTLLGNPEKSRERPPGGNMSAYNAFLQGNAHLERRSADHLRLAIDFYDEAIRIDPRYAVAYAKRSSAWMYLAEQNLGGQEAVDAYAKARAAAKTALALDPDLAPAHVALGYVLMNGDFDFAAAEIELRRGAALAPADGYTKNGLAVLLSSIGRLDEAIELTRQALVIDPLHSGWYTNLAMYLIPLGRFDEAELAARKALALQDAAPFAYQQLAIIAILRGEPAQALQAARQESADNYRRYALALAQQAAGDRAAADAALQLLIAKDANESAFQIASAYAFRKQPDQAFEWLDRAWVLRDSGIADLLADPFLLAYKDDARFVAFCRKVGLPAPAAVPVASNVH